MRADRIIRHILLLSFTLVLFSGCARVESLIEEFQGKGSPQEQQLFLDGLENLYEGREKAPFAALEERYPEGIWTLQARRLQTLLNEQRENSTALRSELSATHQKVKQLETQRAKQKAYIQALKDLIVRLELER